MSENINIIQHAIKDLLTRRDFECFEDGLNLVVKGAIGIQSVRYVVGHFKRSMTLNGKLIAYQKKKCRVKQTKKLIHDNPTR